MNFAKPRKEYLVITHEVSARSGRVLYRVALKAKEKHKLITEEKKIKTKKIHKREVDWLMC